MGKDALQEYIEVLRKRYIQSTRVEKSRILSEFCATGDYDRKYAIKLLGGELLRIERHLRGRSPN